MMKTISKRWLQVGILGLLFLVILCLLAGFLLSRLLGAREFNGQPLVLIHSPANNSQVQVGERMLVHVTARADNGLGHLELWADDVLIAEQEAASNQATSMVLSASWSPRLEGNHELIARAFSSNNVEGQAAVTIAAAPAGPGPYEVQEGDSLDSIATEFGTTPEELADLNPGLGPDGPGLGDGLTLPGDESGEDGSLPSSDGEPPQADSDPPGWDGLTLGVFRLFPLGSGERVTLQVEISDLTTSQAFDGLHCYVELAGSPPQWFPDLDDDQATDESFPSLGGGSWDTSGYLEGPTAPVITWPEGEALPLNVSCVGVLAGVEALDLGRTELLIPAIEWDGIPHEVQVNSGEGSFAFIYRVSRSEDRPSVVPLFLDPTMTPPWDAHIDDRRISLRWEYQPRPDEEPIDGFRIYLNGNLQWVEPADARESPLPYEWLNPPCGSTYTFGVTAFRIGFPDGPESIPSLALLNQPLEDCNREIQIIFHELETYSMPGDGHYEPRTGDIGPAYGAFFANEKLISFDGGSFEGQLDYPIGLFANTVYDLSEMSADPDWNFSGMNGTIVDVPVGGSFQFGYQIFDRDTGRCHDGDEPGCNDTICAATSQAYVENIAADLDQWHDGDLTSEDGRCRVSYSWGPAFNSPVGSGEAGSEPLPWLELTDFTVDENTGQVQIEVRNTGTAFWPWRDLTVELRTRAGETIGSYTWPGFSLEVGATTVLVHDDMTLDPPYDACVVIDPNNEMLEYYERSGALAHTPRCPDLPDLVIRDAVYASGHLHVTVINAGDGALEARTIALRTDQLDGTPLYINGSWPAVSLVPGQARTFDLFGITDSIRERMADGYKVTVDPGDDILEAHESNNTWVVPGSGKVDVYLSRIEVPEDFGDQASFHFDAFLVSAEGREQVIHWDINREIDWGSCFTDQYCVREFYDGEYASGWIDIRGDERLEITIQITHHNSLNPGYTITRTFDPPRWGAGTEEGVYHCSFRPLREDGRHVWTFDTLGHGSWEARFDMCLQTE
jgi:LysM repeat protein